MENDRTFRFFPHSLSEPLVGRHASVILCGRFGTRRRKMGQEEFEGEKNFKKRIVNGKEDRGPRPRLPDVCQ